MSNVLTWLSALNEGHEPSLYPYAAEEVPLGQYEARLDFKIWSRRPLTMSCYFTAVPTGKKFQLSVYRQKQDEVYRLPGSALDFQQCPVDRLYTLTVSYSDQGKIIFKEAVAKNIGQ